MHCNKSLPNAFVSSALARANIESITTEFKALSATRAPLSQEIIVRNIIRIIVRFGRIFNVGLPVDRDFNSGLGEGLHFFALVACRVNIRLIVG